MGVPIKYYSFVDGQTAAGLITAARLNGDLDPLYACLDPATVGLEDTNVKSGAKIVCSDRNYSAITGTWVFSVCPTFPDASIPNAKLSSAIAAWAAHSAADFAVTAKGVTNGDSHDHIGGDGAAIVEAALTLADNTTGDVSATKHGFCPKHPNSTSQFLRGDGAWASTPGYAMALSALTFNPLDGTTYYFGLTGRAPQTSALKAVVQVPKTGTIKAAYIQAMTDGAGTSETVSVYIRKNNTTDTLVADGTLDSANTWFNNAALGISVNAGDYIEIKVVCPTFATNPTSVYFSGHLYLE